MMQSALQGSAPMGALQTAMAAARDAVRADVTAVGHMHEGAAHAQVTCDAW